MKDYQIRVVTFNTHYIQCYLSNDNFVTQHAFTIFNSPCHIIIYDDIIEEIENNRYFRPDKINAYQLTKYAIDGKIVEFKTQTYIL